MGDPEQVCHFLAWDFPHINDVVMNMEPHAYSFSDLVKLVQVINEGIQQFCIDQHRPSRCRNRYTEFAITGQATAIYHQHYQFFRLPHVPLLDGKACHDGPDW